MPVSRPNLKAVLCKFGPAPAKTDTWNIEVVVNCTRERMFFFSVDDYSVAAVCDQRSGFKIRLVQVVAETSAILSVNTNLHQLSFHHIF